MVRFFSEADVQQQLSITQSIEIMEEAFLFLGKGKAVDHPRQRIRLPKGFFHMMTAAIYERGIHGFKSYSVGGSNLVSLYDSSNGILLALFQANILGQLRTGAVSGLATRYMACPDARIVACIGTGFQAETQLEAICAVRPIEEIRAYSRLAERREAFAERMAARLGIAVESVESAQACVQGANIINVTTTSREPVLYGGWLEKGQHINASGSNHWMRRELDDEAILVSDRIIVDSIATAQLECGELIWAVDRSFLNWGRVRELSDVVAGTLLGRAKASEVTLFESQGLAIEDLAVADWLYRHFGEEMPETLFETMELEG